MTPIKLSPLPEWREVPDAPGAWTCDDVAEQCFAWLAAMVGFDLPSLDRWMSALPEGTTRTALHERRELAKAADPNNGHMRAALDGLHLRRFIIEREGFLLPLARRGSKFAGGKPKGAAGAMRALVRRLLKAKGDRLTARELWTLAAALPESKRRGVEFFGGNAWISGHGNVSFARFANIVSEEKKRPK